MKRLERNSKLFLIEVDGKDADRLVYGKGRNSVSQKAFGVRAFQAIKNGLAKSITAVERGKD